MPRRGSNPGVGSPGDPSPSQMPTRPSRANSCRGLQNSRTCGARWVLLSAARPSPRPCTTRCGPAPAPAALPRPRRRPCCSGEGCRRPPRVARRRPNLRSSQRCRSCHRSFQPTSRRRPSRSSARRLRTRTRVGRRVASRHGASLHAGPSAPAASNPVDASQLCIVGCPCLAARPVPHSTRRASPGTSQHVKVTKSCLRLTRPEDVRPPPAASSFALLRGWRARGILNPAAPDHLSNPRSAP